MLSDLETRGILVIVQCCGGAGLAENAPNVFYRLEDRDFRLFISGSRASQSSWELPGDKGSLFTTHLLEAVSGSKTIGCRGEIFFTELFDHLHTSMQASAERMLGNRSAQEPVFSGSYGRDPLLFLHKDLSLSQISLQTERLTRADFRRRTRALVAGQSALTLLSLGGYWAWQDGQQFLLMDRVRLTLSHGHPELSGFGYPKLDWIYPLGPNAIVSDRRDRTLAGVAFPRRLEPEGMLSNLLAPIAATRVLTWHRRDGEARQILLANKTLFVSTQDGQQLLPDLVAPEDKDWLADRIETADGLEAAALVAALAEIDQEAAAAALGLSAISDDVGHQLNLLKVWRAPCGPALQSWMETFLSKDSAAFALPAIVQMAVRAECRFPADVALVAQPKHLESAIYGLRLTDPDSLPELRAAVADQIRSDLEAIDFDIFDPSLPNKHRLLAAHVARMARYMGDMPCFDGWVTRFNKDVFDGISQSARLDAIIATARDCPDAAVTASTGPVALHVSIKFGVTASEDVLYVPTAPDLDASVLPVLDALIEVDADGLTEALRDVLVKTDSAELRYQVAERLRAIGADGGDALSFAIVDAPRLDVSLLRWLAVSSPEMSAEKLVDMLLERRDSALLEGLVHIPVSGVDRTRLLNALARAEPEVKLPAIALLGTPDQAAALLVDRAPGVRDIGATYTPLRADFGEIERLAGNTGRPADPFLNIASERYAKGLEFEELLFETPEWARRWRALWLDHSFIDDYTVSLLFARVRVDQLESPSVQE